MTGMGSALGEIATEAALERTSFLSAAGKQLHDFLESNKQRIKEAGGLVLIDEDPDYLSVAPDGSFRSRTRYQDEVTGEWRSETEVIDTAAELVELYNPAEIFAAFAESARAAAVGGRRRNSVAAAGRWASRVARVRQANAVAAHLDRRGDRARRGGLDGRGAVVALPGAPLGARPAGGVHSHRLAGPGTTYRADIAGADR